MTAVYNDKKTIFLQNFQHRWDVVAIFSIQDKDHQLKRSHQFYSYFNLSEEKWSFDRCVLVCTITFGSVISYNMRNLAMHPNE